MTSRVVILIPALALLTGCAGPTRPVDLGFKEVPSNVILGAHPTTTPLGGPVPPPLPTGIVSLPPPHFPLSAPPGPPITPAATPAPASAPSCPATDPLAAPQREATPSVGAPPVGASYLFRNNGSYRVSGADPQAGSFPATSTRTVSHVTGSANDFSYAVTETLSDITTTTTYRITTTGTVPAPGVYLVSVTSRQAGGTTAAFTPTPALQLAALPLVQGATLDARGADPLTQTTETFHSTVRGKARVDACGVPLDSWTIDLSSGQVLSPSQNLSFAATYQLATQYGGIIVKDSVAFAGTDSGAGVSRSNVATIAAPPKTP